MSKINELKFDDKNFNKHTQKGMGLLEKSLQQFGAGRSILIDKDNNIIAGNGVVEAAGQIGLDDVQIVESDGKMEQKQLTELIECNRFWDYEEKQAFINAGGGWDGIGAVIELDQRRFYGK